MPRQPSSVLLRKLDRSLKSKIERRRWEAAAELSEFAQGTPIAIWDLVVKHGSSDDPDLQTAIATCALEHILEHHFKPFFDLIEKEVLAGNHALANTLSRCWKLGEAEKSINAKRWDTLVRKHSTR